MLRDQQTISYLHLLTLLWLRLLWQVLRDHQTIYEPPALPSRLQAEFGETQFEMQPEDTRRHALPPLVGAAREGTQEEEEKRRRRRRGGGGGRGGGKEEEKWGRRKRRGVQVQFLTS